MTEAPNNSDGVAAVLSDDYLTLTEATKRLPRSNGRRIHTSTLWRWCRRGCNGIYLQYFRTGRTIWVTEEALHRFFTELAMADSAQSAKSLFKATIRQRRARPAQRQAAVEEANAILRKAKILV